MASLVSKNKNVADQLSVLSGNIARLNNQFSFGQAFLRGIISGLGSAIGATIILGLIVYLLGALRFIPWIGESINSYVIEMTRNIPTR